MLLPVSLTLLALVLFQTSLWTTNVSASVFRFQAKRPGTPFHPKEKQWTIGNEKDRLQCTAAAKCDHDKCRLPCCLCSGIDIPGGLAVEKVPQMVSLTFQASITPSSYLPYGSIFRGRVNPNGCPMSGTFFVLHEYTNYTLAYNLYAARQELGVNAIFSDFDWKNATEKEWEDQLGGERQIISKFANVSLDAIRGARSPFLQMGGDNQLTALKNVGLLYDSSRVSTFYCEPPNLLWPYSYDYASIQDCPSTNCPICSYPCIWEVPLLAFRCPDGTRSATADGCRNITTESDAYQLLLNKFNAHYKSANRAPMVVSFGAAWMLTKYKLDATVQFLDYLSKLKDVYVVSAGKVIDWAQHPTDLASLPNFKPWKCDDALNECNDVVTCLYDEHRKLLPPGSEAKYRLSACVKACPQCYPWLGDPTGASC